MPMTTNKSNDTISEETSESGSPISKMKEIFQRERPSQKNLMTGLNTLLAAEEETKELQEYWQGNPDYDTRPKTLVRQFIITISKSKIETVEIPGIQDLKLPGIKDLKSRGFITDLESYWKDTPDIKVRQKPA